MSRTCETSAIHRCRRFMVCVSLCSSALLSSLKNRHCFTVRRITGARRRCPIHMKSEPVFVYLFSIMRRTSLTSSCVWFGMLVASYYWFTLRSSQCNLYCSLNLHMALFLFVRSYGAIGTTDCSWEQAFHKCGCRRGSSSTVMLVPCFLRLCQTWSLIDGNVSCLSACFDKRWKHIYYHCRPRCRLLNVTKRCSRGS